MDLSDATGKILVTPGLDPGTFRLVAQCLNHYATPGTFIELIYRAIYASSCCGCDNEIQKRCKL